MKNYAKSAFYGVPLTAERLRSVLRYEPETGRFSWLAGGRGRFKRPGATAGTTGAHGYVAISVDGCRYQAHRLAWFYVHGAWPKGEIDHINGRKTDNRAGNLRDVDRQTNAENLRGARKDSGSGLLGAYWNKARGVWVSSITVKGQQNYLGDFPSPQAASAAYLAAKRLRHAGCTI